MKYFVLALIAFSCFSCEPSETFEERMKRMEDSMNDAADSIVKVELAKKKKTEDSIAAIKLREKTMCPELIPFFEMSDRYVATMKNGELGDSLTKNFGLINDSIIALEKKIMDKEFSKMDTACQLIFLRRMSQKTFDMTDELMKKLK